MPKERQPELTLFEQRLTALKPDIKRILQKQWKVPHSVVVDFADGSIRELRGAELAQVNEHDQWAVLNEQWLERLRYAVGVLNTLRERQQRETQHIIDLVQEILDESMTLSAAELPKRVNDAYRRAHGIPEILQGDPEPFDDAIRDLPEDENDVPF